MLGKRVALRRKTSPHVASRRRLVDHVTDVDERIPVRRSVLPAIHRQPEVDYRVQDDIIGGQSAQRKYVAGRPQTAVVVVCKVALID